MGLKHANPTCIGLIQRKYTNKFLNSSNPKNIPIKHGGLPPEKWIAEAQKMLRQLLRDSGTLFRALSK